MELNEIEFWEYNNDTPKILHARLIKFLESNNISRVELNVDNQLIVKEKDNILSTISEAYIAGLIRNYLEEKGKDEIYEVFARGLGSFISKKKLNLLTKTELINDRDERYGSNMFFKNCFCHVNLDSIEVFSYAQLPFKIWDTRIIDREFRMPGEQEGQFETFCKRITKSDERLEALMSIIGYLLHRNKDKGETVAIILYDEKMGDKGQANGGTGKTLLSDAIKQCREVEKFNGKELKSGSWFQHQRINLTTDVLVYDDLNPLTSLEIFFPMLTTGIEVEKKRQQSYFIGFEKSPKVLITSNYLVKGPGGNSDERRRHEFEIINHYNLDRTPEKEFGNMFFGPDWSKKEWNMFYYFMMRCIRVYLNHGLIKVDPINLKTAKKEISSCSEFLEFAELIVESGKWTDKREFEGLFKSEYPQYEDVSSKMIGKWLANYAVQSGGEYQTRSSGGDYYFMIKSREGEEE